MYIEWKLHSENYVHVIKELRSMARGNLIVVCGGVSQLQGPHIRSDSCVWSRHQHIATATMQRPGSCHREEYIWTREREG